MSKTNVAEPGTYDLLIKGGEIIDPGSGLSSVQDVAICGDTIADVGPDIDPSTAKEVVDAKGTYVTPGLLDLHTHVYWGSTYWGIEPDPVAARTGVTTWLDVGSSGAYSFPGFRRYVVEATQVRVFSLLNLSAIGLIAPTWEFANLDYCDVELAQTIIEENRDVILGIKARIDCNTTRGVGIRALEIARTLSDTVDLPLMTHIGAGPPSIQEVIPHLRPGDIVTHCFTGQSMKMLDDQGNVLPEIKQLHDEGVILDIGHGAGSFSFETAERMLDQGIEPDVISSDIHQMAIQGPAFNLPVTLSKFLLLGMPLADIVACATSKPAEVMRQPHLGSLKPGSAADVALFTIESGDYTFQDVFMNERKGDQMLVNTLTIAGGLKMKKVPLPTLLPWSGIPSHQRGKVIPLVEIPDKQPSPLLDNRSV